MVTRIKRKLYRRGSSYETTIPMPLLFAVDKEKKQNVIFNYDPGTQRWYINFEEMGKEVRYPPRVKKPNRKSRR